MKIPLPCEFGDLSNCNGIELPLKGASWFQWSEGMEFTYFFATHNCWRGTEFYSTFNSIQPYEFVIPDELLSDRSIKEHGYPLKGRGYASGLHYENGKTYIDFIITSNYLTHIRVQCDKNGIYIPNGHILFPPSWDTEEKRENAILKSCKIYHGTQLGIKRSEQEIVDGKN